MTTGWSINSITIVQSGLPYVVYTSATFQPTFDAKGNVNGLKASSGDYNADGYNRDYPNVASYQTLSSTSAYLNGVFAANNFTTPGLGMEGNEIPYRFRGPNYKDTDTKLTVIWRTALLDVPHPN